MTTHSDYLIICFLFVLLSIHSLLLIWISLLNSSACRVLEILRNLQRFIFYSSPTSSCDMLGESINLTKTILSRLLLSKNHTCSMTRKVKLVVFLLTVAVVGMLKFNVRSSPATQTSAPSLSKDNLLFMRHVEPFLSAKTDLSVESFTWWRHIQFEPRDLGYFKLTQKRLFEIFPSFPIFEKPTADRIRSCAVVGNSVNLKGSGYGRLIDSHEVIIRMNFGPVKGYEEDVGTKTTHRAMYPESAMDLDNCTHLVLFPFKINDIEWIIKAFTTGFYGRSYAPIKSKIKANKNLVLVVNPAFMKYAHEIWLEKMGSYPSTGFMTFLLTLHVCDEVHVFGFGADNKGSWKHYWETLQNKNFKTGPHPGPHEYKIIQRLADGKTIKLYKGS
ncbi:CMP-N-acetylneuraminate-beta-galactosamide-alpha-2,3-sialyltransferase 1-like [Xiphophorus hellerii]|uniref:CMP-N-acetylneuraminate-beta-galactosamide- alpha-2,3-sialyltransferase 1-like n=1 Tax=Xiphophorus hellerii TaxID=8084 RepID=UPI0013B3E6E4|nr:CMP-N-acetylneuraminate-beta-galactosamide-alpha-2,3-sialyltransferase 1-like [Xiphophorus hellerii]